MLWGISEMVNARAFKPCHCVQHPWKLTSRDFWCSRNERKPLSKQKCGLRKCCGVSQKWWMLELSNLCHCVQHPWRLTSMDFWFSVVKQLELSSAYFERYYRNWQSITEVNEWKQYLGVVIHEIVDGGIWVNWSGVEIVLIAFFIDLVQEYVLRWCMYICVNSHCK